MEALYSAIVGYLIGTISPSYILGRLHGFDIRSRGSGNAGASNIIITLGKGPGAVIAFLDIFKAILAIMLCGKMFSACTVAREIAGTACVLGHIFPFYMHFHGGKGLACMGGVIIAYSPRLFLVIFALALLLSFLTDYICFVPIIGSLVYPVLYGYLTHRWLGALIYCIVPVVMCYKHIENLRRIKNGTEARFSFLWKRDQEIDRLTENSEADAEAEIETETEL